MARLFLYDGRTFPDPDPRLTVDDVRRQLSDFFPELANADTREERRDEDALYTFARRIGTKGGGRRRRRPPDVVAILKNVPTRELRIFELASALLLPDGTLDVDAAARREPELALAQAEAEAYARATQLRPFLATRSSSAHGGGAAAEPCGGRARFPRPRPAHDSRGRDSDSERGPNRPQS